MWTTIKKTTYWGKKVLSCSFYLYRLCKYMSYSFPIINFWNPRVRFEMPCIVPEFVYVSLEPVWGTGLWMYLELNVCATAIQNVGLQISWRRNYLRGVVRKYEIGCKGSRLWRCECCNGGIFYQLYVWQLLTEDCPEHGLCCCDMLIVGELPYLAVGAVPWFRWLVVDLSFWRPGLDSRLVHVGFVVYEVVLGWCFHWVVQFFLTSVIPPVPSIRIWFFVDTVWGNSEGKVYILGGDSIEHCENKSSNEVELFESPDLPLLVFFFFFWWALMKNEVYKRRVDT